MNHKSQHSDLAGSSTSDLTTLAFYYNSLVSTINLNKIQECFLNEKNVRFIFMTPVYSELFRKST